jgi:hypothetical protein
MDRKPSGLVSYSPAEGIHQSVIHQLCYDKFNNYNVTSYQYLPYDTREARMIIDLLHEKLVKDQLLHAK